MNIRTQQRLLLGLAAIFAIASVGVVYWSVAELPNNADKSSAPTAGQRNIGDSLNSQNNLIGADLAKRSLRGPMTDAPTRREDPIKPKPKVSQKPIVRTPVAKGPRFKLVGTVIDSSNPVAIISDSMGKTDAKGVGDQLELTPSGVTIESIKPQQVTLRYQGKPTVVSLNKPDAASSGSTNSGSANSVSGPAPTMRPVGGRGR